MSFLRLYWPLLLFAILWIDLIRRISPNWEAREEYAYGWFVPFFAAYLFWRRWPDRPTAKPGPGPSWLLGLVCLAGLALLPMRVIFEINADWPTITYSYSAIVVALTGFALLRAGGWPWVWHFGFAVAFFFVALPWPYGIERGLTQNLMRIVASITVEILGVLGVPAMQHGNLIEVGTGVVGVDEACSGIRSFQSTLMAGLLMGEMYRLKWHGRLTLLGLGLGFAFLLNVVRTFILTWQVQKNGLSALDKWHDPAGLTIAVACFLALWGVAAWAQKRWGVVPAPHPAPTPGQLPSAPTLPPDPRPLLGYLRVAGVWVILVLVFTEVWYRANATEGAGSFQWAARMPTNETSFKSLEVPRRAQDLLKYDTAVTGTWRNSDGTEWTAFFFRWEPKSIQAIFSARIHRPDICLPGAGLTQTTNFGLATFPAHALGLPFTRYTFASDGEPLHVFFCQWEDGWEKQSGLATSRKSGRIRTAFEGKRYMGQQSLEFILKGYPDFAAAEAALRQRLPDFVEMQARAGK